MSCLVWAGNLPNIPGQALDHVLNDLLMLSVHTFSGNLITALGSEGLYNYFMI